MIVTPVDIISERIWKYSSLINIILKEYEDAFNYIVHVSDELCTESYVRDIEYYRILNNIWFKNSLESLSFIWLKSSKIGPKSHFSALETELFVD